MYLNSTVEWLPRFCYHRAMFLDRFTVEKRLLTSAEILAALQRRMCMPWMRPMTLTRDTTIWEWRMVGDGLWVISIFTELSGDYWSDVAESLNQQFGIDVSDRDWFAVIKPGQSTLGQLCDFIAARALVEVTPAVNMSAKPCRMAGLFLALRARLQAMHDMGAGLHPSSLLPDGPEQAFRVREAWELIAPESAVKLEPVEPPAVVKVWLRWLWVLLPLLMGITMLVFLMVFWWQTPEVVTLALCLFSATVLCFGVTVYITLLYDRWHWPGLRTYRDLVKISLSN